MADLQRSRPSLRRRILGAFEPLLTSSSSSSPTSPTSPAMPTKVLRKKRRGPSTSPRPDIPQAYRSNERSRSPFGRMLQHHRAPSSDDAPATSTSSRSSSELHTPSSPGKRAAWDRDSPASSRSSLHRSNCVHGPKPVRASNPATVVAHDQMSSQHNGISFPVDDRHDESRPHSSSDYYRLTQTGNLAGHVGGHMRCFSQPNSEPVRRTGLTVHQQPSTLSLRSVDLNRDLPPLPFDQDKSVPPLPISRSSTSGSSDADEDDGEQDDFLLAPGTFARVVGEDEEENDDLDELCRATAEGCSDHCCKPAALPLSLVIGPTGVSRRNSLPASLEGLKFVQAKLHDITPCDKTPHAAETAIFARSPGAAPRHRLTPAMKEALVQDGQRQSFLARAASLTKATTFTLKNVRSPRSLRRPGVPARIDEDTRIAAA